MGRSTVHYADNKTNNALKKLHNKLRPAGTPVQRVEYIIELLLLRIFETKIKKDEEFKPLRKLFTTDYRWKNPKTGQEESNENRLFSYLPSVSNDQILSELNDNFFPFYSTILQSARKVFIGNLPQKVQDQLVLIEEVFGNSNFTNNVNSGNLGEVISIVANDIDETRLLKTDLLGDAIESALSETGGTKDIGLFRTPDHIRQFMTALVEPTFNDIIFDPACGTGGFLFDSFEFVMQRYLNDKAWPGEKAHPELKEWFANFFGNNPVEMPSEAQSKQFYRSGVSGIEYLGMIRKMAAINFYIRGLNPANIEQGDSLAKYNPVIDHESKSIVLANPPFGAERDQESYPEVWGEYSKESETTILFVKLMFELLKQGGKCAVIVSEGFHTWDQSSAKALRKMLLEEAQLKAVISLPQGLFVSKNGQGPKTSILLYEKGGSTDWVWFYKVTNDGYTMGTNRKEQKGNQLVDCLKLYHQHVKHGNKPQENKNHFCVPAEWIKTLDPRIKEKIRNETRTDMVVKGKLERTKKEEELDKKIKAKKITVAQKLMDLKVFDQSLENRIQNEIAKRIDKAHSYSFNLANYKSTLSDSQIAEWNEALKHIKPNGPATVEDVYKKLNNTQPENALPYLLKLNPINALEADIAREYVRNIDESTIGIHKELATIKEIIESGAKFTMVKLGQLIYSIADERKIIIEKDEIYKDLTISTKTNLISIRNEEEGKYLKVKNRILIKKGDLVIGLLHTQNGSFALSDDIYASTGTFIPFKIDESQVQIKYLIHLLKSTLANLAKEDTTGRENYKVEEILELKIPLPKLEEQTVIVNLIDRQKAIIDGADRILSNWSITEADFIIDESSYNEIPIYNIGNIGTGSTPSRDVKEYFNGEINWVLTGEVQMNEIVKTTEKLSKKAIEDYGLKIYPVNTVLIAMYGQGKTRGQSSILRIPAAITQNCAAITCNEEVVVPEYLWYYLIAIYEKIRSQDYSGGGVPHLNLKIVKNIKIPIPEISIQKEIISELSQKVKLLDGLKKMKSESEKKISQILSDVWGVEYVESIAVEVEE